MKTYPVFGINGPIIIIDGPTSLQISEMVYVGKSRLVGEVIGVSSSRTTIQVYEDTSGLYPGEDVESTGNMLSALLGPGLLGGIFDGIERPLDVLAKKTGAFIQKGTNVPSLDENKLWNVTVLAKEGEEVRPGQIIAQCPETGSITHKILLPPDVSGTVTFAAPDGEYRLNDCIIRVRDSFSVEREISLCHRWPIRIPRPITERLPLSVPLITGQRIIDAIFPIAKGGTAAIPGGFGTGKTVMQHQLAKWSDADIIIYVGCGERGNEMTQALTEFSELTDPKTGRSMLERTLLIANTSNMPVAAREASIYTGITIAEYYRDMGLNVAMMADSTSRWAEALREISGRLEEMPADEGYPAYLPSRLSQFYERAGMCETLGGDKGSVTVIGAVSPQGSDFSEPVTQNTKRFTCCFWGLDKNLAHARHFPSINWITSYSEYIPVLTNWYNDSVSPDFIKCRAKILEILNYEDSLQEIVKLVGSEVLPDDQKLILEISKVIRLGFLQQDAMNPTDTYVSLEKQLRMMKIILYLYDRCLRRVQLAVPMSSMTSTGIFDRLAGMKFEIPNDDLSGFDSLIAEIDKLFKPDDGEVKVI